MIATIGMTMANAELAIRRIAGALADIPVEERQQIIDIAVASLKDVDTLRMALKGCEESMQNRSAIPTLPKLLIQAKRIVRKLEESGEPSLHSKNDSVEASEIIGKAAEASAFGAAPSRVVKAILRDTVSVLAPDP